ncbi:MAG: DoxX family protein [Phycisphaerales bacterium]|nr:DoxX family protein [Phycisphaerales bacterium]
MTPPLSSSSNSPSNSNGAVTDSASCCSQGGSCGCPLRVVVPTTLRLVLGGLLMYSGWLKLGISSFGGTLPTSTPAAFAETIKKFDLPLVGDDVGIISILAFMIPWTELIIGVLMVLGLWTRAAALVATGLLVSFTVGLGMVMARGMEMSCSCFGSAKFLCGETVGACHLARNAALIAMGVMLVWKGSGALGLDRLLSRRRG